MPENPVPADSPATPAEAGRKEFPTYRRGRWWPAFALLLAPFMLIFKFILPPVKEHLNWRAALGTIFIFEALMLGVEHVSVKRGHWVYNEARILGPKLFGIPIEEPLLYYWFPPLLVIVMMLLFYRELLKRESR